MGIHMLVVYFKDKDSFLIWDEHPEHKKYKERGKTDILKATTFLLVKYLKGT